MIYVFLASQFLWMVICVGLIQSIRQQSLDALNERSQLLDRIQRPDLLPVRPSEPQEFLSEEEDEEYAKVGTINWGDNNKS